MATTVFSRKMGQGHILGLGEMLEAYGLCLLLELAHSCPKRSPVLGPGA